MTTDEYDNLFPALFPNFNDSMPLLECSLCYERGYNFKGQKIIWGNGSQNAKLMAIGMDSGGYFPSKLLWRGSILTGFPLTNENSGKRFRRLLNAAGIDSSYVFITNLVKCNDSPVKEEIKQIRNKYEKRRKKIELFKKLSAVCISYLKNELCNIRPEVIIMLGEDVKYMLDDLIDWKKNILIVQDLNFSLSNPFEGELDFAPGYKAKVFNLWHPSRLGYTNAENQKELEKKYKEDLIIIQNFL